MNSLVVLFSVLALAAASPSLAPTLLASHVVAPAYAAPLAYGPAAISHQSRIDYKTSPAFYSYASPVYAPLAKTVIAPAFVPAAVSHQSRIDIKSSPTIAYAAPVAPVLKTYAPFVTPALATTYGHFIRKRSAPALYTPYTSYTSYAAPAVSYHTPLTYSAPIYRPIAYHTPVKAYSVHPW